MKVDTDASTDSGTSTRRSADGERFQRALQESAPRRPPARPAPGEPKASVEVKARPLSLPLGARSLSTVRTTTTVLATSRGVLASPERLGMARQAMHVESYRLGTVRSEAQGVNQERTEQRLTELVVREVSRQAAHFPTTRESSSPRTEPVPVDSSRPVPTQEGTLPEARQSASASTGASPPEPPSRVESTLEVIERIEVLVKSQRPALSLSVRGSLHATVEVERTGPREVALRIQGHQGPVPDTELTRLRDALEARGLRLRSLSAG
ncbi:hypothetical protein SAMN05443572_10918 [Myxococcus fulvus]|uniref:Uncharacterized protein n=1 Tax=Myxococcus fulvus TaxID=33 RepID=A0A511T601_MYXFU|nr:hypothetical protein [Myxococcus fulvus]GEN09367.1 hypothetical protein MFU01_44040 [Myxococcus fulvus]SEU31769.1 hypothetical protein SAMN05443572_10918 [Myxococcus fulvus]